MVNYTTRIPLPTVLLHCWLGGKKCIQLRKSVTLTSKPLFCKKCQKKTNGKLANLNSTQLRWWYIYHKTKLYNSSWVQWHSWISHSIYLCYNVAVVAKCIYEPVDLQTFGMSAAECNRCSPPSSLVYGELLTIMASSGICHKGCKSPSSFDRMHSSLDWLAWKLFKTAQ